MTLYLQEILLISVCILNVALATLIFFQNRKSAINITFALFSFFVGLWSFAIALYLQANTDASALLYIKLAYLAALYLGASFYSFTIVFPENRHPSILTQILIGGFCVGFSLVLLLIPNFLTRGVIVHSWGREVILGVLEYLFFLTAFSFLFIGGIWRGWRKYLRSEGLLRSQWLYIILSVSVAGSCGMLFNLVLPSVLFRNFEWIWLGPLFTTIIVIFVTAAIVKTQLFNIRVILTELLVGVISVLLLMNVFTGRGIIEIGTRLGIFVAFLVGGYLLVKSVFDEIKYRTQLNTAYEELKQLDHAKSEFISIASHQLRAPLTAIKGYIAMMLEGTYGQLPIKERRPLENVYASNERLIKLVNDLLDLSRIESGKIDVNLSETNIEKVIESVIEELSLKAKEKGLKLILKRSKEKIPVVLLDEQKVRNIVLNLIDNAIRYTDKGGIVVAVQRIKDKGSDVLRIEVHDSGQGMTGQEISHLFESFSRGGAGVKAWADGAGLGLYIARKFIEMQHGRIWATSEGNERGSVFHVELPVSLANKGS